MRLQQVSANFVPNGDAKQINSNNKRSFRSITKKKTLKGAFDTKTACSKTSIKMSSQRQRNLLFLIRREMFDKMFICIIRPF